MRAASRISFGTSPRAQPVTWPERRGQVPLQNRTILSRPSAAPPLEKPAARTRHTLVRKRCVLPVSASKRGSEPLFLPPGYRDVPVEEKKGLVHEVFERVAPKYDVMNDLMSGGLHRIWKDHLVRAVSRGMSALRLLKDSIDEGRLFMSVVSRNRPALHSLIQTLMPT